MDKIRLFGLTNCGSCKKAIKHLKLRALDFEFIDIRESPPQSKLFEDALESGIERKRFLNTSGGLYRSGNFKTELPDLSKTDFAKTLAANPMLVKRPFLVGSGIFLFGYRPDEYDAI